MSSDMLIQEVDEELRRDRMRKLWRQTGPWIIAAAVAVVLGVAAYEGWTWWQKTQSASSSDQFYAATKLADGTDFAAAKKALDDVIAKGSGGYPVLAQFREAALLAQQGKTDDAVAAYDALSSSINNTHLRELALVLAGNLLVDKGDVAAVEQRVGGLMTPASPMRNAAREEMGLVQYKAGKLDDAMKSFEAVVDDPLSSRDEQSRVQIYMLQLEAEGAKPPAPPADATTSSAPAALAEDAGEIEPEHHEAREQHCGRRYIGPAVAAAVGALGRARRAPVEPGSPQHQQKFDERRHIRQLPEPEAKPRQVERVAGQDRQVHAVHHKVEDPVREGDEPEHDADAPVPDRPAGGPEDGRERDRAHERMRVVGVNDPAAIARGRAGRRLDGFHMSQEQRHEHHVEPGRREHHRPERGRRFPGLHRGRQAEMSGDHCSLPLRALGHLMRASMTPQMRTNRNKAIRNCTGLSQRRTRRTRGSGSKPIIISLWGCP